jgi:hypothetical protein
MNEKQFLEEIVLKHQRLKLHNPNHDKDQIYIEDVFKHPENFSISYLNKILEDNKRDQAKVDRFHYAIPVVVIILSLIGLGVAFDQLMEIRNSFMS